LKPSLFNVISASAGSGKTFAVTKAYLKILLTNSNDDEFKRILAITFTNKAVGEMKERIIDTLILFSTEKILHSNHPMMDELQKETGLTVRELHIRSKQVIDHILHNYGGFEISTIDSFVYRIIRTFAFELGLPNHFEVELNQDDLLSEAVDRLISEADRDNPITATLVDYALEKSDDDKSFDISYDLKLIAQLLVNEEDLTHVDTLTDKTTKDFFKWKLILVERMKKLKSAIRKQADQALTLMSENDVDGSELIRGINTYFDNLYKGNYAVSYKNIAWQEKLEFDGTIFLKKLPQNKQETIAALQDELKTIFVSSRRDVTALWFAEALYKNLVPLSILQSLQTALNTIKHEEGKILISEFNALVNKEIQKQPVPYIFERLGERLNHFFIDEFQDTSVMQWQNLIPLLDNSLSQEHSSTTIVGDAKQAIYRWRGGEVGQFIDLFTERSQPFQAKAANRTLEYNYRSTQTIVNFNNSFFSYLSDFVFSNQAHADIFKSAKQKVVNTHDGYIGFQFYELATEEEKNEVFPAAVVDIISDCLERGYRYSDICILVRKRKHGVVLANKLGTNDIPITSSETLLLKNSPKVQLLRHLLELSVHPDNLKIKAEALYQLAELKEISDKHLFISNHLQTPLHQLLSSFAQLTSTISEDLLPFYERVELYVEALGFNQRSDAFIQSFLDLVHEYTLKREGDIGGFLEYFQQNEDRLSISTPKNRNAVSIMTIHKAKGLEFPIVIFPFAEINIYEDRNSHIWVPIDPEQNAMFKEAMINVKADMAYYNEVCDILYKEHQSNLELDHLNLLYVALTRPVQEMYIVCKRDIGKSGANIRSFAGLFISYLDHLHVWRESESQYSFGTKSTTDKKEEVLKDETLQLVSSLGGKRQFSLVTSSGALWDSESSSAIEKGNTIHTILSMVKTSDDIPFALNSVISAGHISEKDRSEYATIISSVVNHPDLNKFFTHEYTVYNERELLTPDASSLRPDRLCISAANEASIIDYKTGRRMESHADQLERYKAVVGKMGYKRINAYLVYTNDPVEIAEV
jgi:ATP-dependent exoDNAse (exonuclease V) beta subunit